MLADRTRRHEGEFRSRSCLAGECDTDIGACGSNGALRGRTPRCFFLFALDQTRATRSRYWHRWGDTNARRDAQRCALHSSPTLGYARVEPSIAIAVAKPFEFGRDVSGIEQVDKVCDDEGEILARASSSAAAARDWRMSWIMIRSPSIRRCVGHQDFRSLTPIVIRACCGAATAP